MNIDDFQDLVDRCGERPDDWPADIRVEAVNFLASSREAQEIVAEAASMRSMFADPALERAPDHLAGRIFAMAERMDEFRPTINRDLRRNRVRFSDRARPFDAPHADKTIDPSAPGPGLPPKVYLWFGVTFLAGLGMGVAGTVLGTGHQIDFATLFAVVS